VCLGVHVAACVSGWVGGWVCTTKTSDRSDLKLGTQVVLDTMRSLLILGSKGQGLELGFRVRVGLRLGLEMGLGLVFRVYD